MDLKSIRKKNGKIAQKSWHYFSISSWRSLMVDVLHNEGFLLYLQNVLWDLHETLP